VTIGAETASALSGPDLYALFSTAATWLERNAPAINAINVFPVPDGDTGTNMSLTLRAAVDEARAAGPELDAVAAALAHGAIMGARGNSGVILSQYLKGLATRLAGLSRADGAALAAALAAGAEAAARAVARPVEGTMLTVAREAGQAAARAAADGHDTVGVLAAAVAAARAAVQRTPELLPVLREAGVVDSGGLGLCVVLEGALRHLQGAPLPEAPSDAGHIAPAWLEAHRTAHERGDERYGYCIQFLVRTAPTSADDLRVAMTALGDSVVVVEEQGVLHVHVHCPDPGAPLSRAAGYGPLTAIKVENMDEQAAQIAPDTAPPTSAAPFSVVAVASGAGIAAALRGAGAEQIVSGGRTMNPSAREILAAIEAASRPVVVVLPNHKNVGWTAEQAAALSSKRVEVLPTRSVPQGIAALLALNPDAEPEAALAAMRQAIGHVRTVEVTHAARPTRVDGAPVRAGQPIALVDGELALTAPSLEEAVIHAVARVRPTPGALITVFYGEAVPPERAADLAAELRRHYPQVEVELVAGGQPLYDYIVGIE
jgi:DAK2 domain fusion protein YloV